MLDSLTSTPKPPGGPDERRSLLVFAFQTDQRANGGLESLTLVLENLREFAPRIVTQRETPMTNRWRRDGFPVDVVNMPAPAARWHVVDRVAAFAKRLPAVVRGQLETMRRVRAEGAKVVHFNDANSVAYGAIGARLGGARVVVALRDTTGIERWRWQLIGHVADVVVTLSDDMRERYVATLAHRRFPRIPRPVEPARIITIPSIVAGVSAPRDSERLALRAELGIPPHGFSVGVVGSVIPRKRQLDVVRILGPRFGRDDGGLGHDPRLFFVGDFEPTRDGYAAECESARRALDRPERVRFVGFSARPSDWLRALDLVVVASDSEGLARAMIESLSFGTPVVSTDVCSAREVLERSEAGVVVACGDFEALASAVERLASDPAERRRLGDNGARLVARDFAAPTVAHRYDALYASLADSAEAGSKPGAGAGPSTASVAVQE